MGDVSGDIYIHGGLPQSRYCSTCAHYQTLSGSSIGGNCGGSARACLYILDIGRRRGCPAGAGCPHRITPEDWAKEKSGMEAMRARMRSSRGGAKNRGRKKEST